MHRIAINPANSNEILVVLSNYKLVGLYHSSNGGQSFTAVEGNLVGTESNGPSLRSATILPLPATTIYFLGTSTGVYSTNLLDGSSTIWSQEGADEIGNVVVEDITSRTSDYKVAAGTHGRGIFIATYSPAEVGDEDSNGLPDAFQMSQNYPNPFNPATTIEYVLPAAQHVVLKVYDMLGKEVDQIINSAVPAGTHKIQYQPQSLASGVYVYMIDRWTVPGCEKICFNTVNLIHLRGSDNLGGGLNFIVADTVEPAGLFFLLVFNSVNNHFNQLYSIVDRCRQIPEPDHCRRKYPVQPRHLR